MEIILPDDEKAIFRGAYRVIVQGEDYAKREDILTRIFVILLVIFGAMVVGAVCW